MGKALSVILGVVAFVVGFIGFAITDVVGIVAGLSYSDHHTAGVSAMHGFHVWLLWGAISVVAMIVGAVTLVITACAAD